jgi:spermidine synthase
VSRAVARKKKKAAARDRPPAAVPAPVDAPSPLPAVAYAVAPLLFASGLCALVYQIAWQREFRLIFGSSTSASAAVVAVFMGGLGFGGWVLGPRADRRANPLRFYAALEAAVALTAGASPWLLDLVRRVYLALGGTEVLGSSGGMAMRLVLASLVLAPPTFLAGGTLGAAARAVEHERDLRRRGTALLYGVNAMGAVAGCLLATFFLLEAAGTRATLWLAAAANLLVALAAAAIAARSGVVSTASPPTEDRPERPPAADPRLVLAAAALVGFAFFLLELVWYRMLGPILGGTVYTFGLVLAVALFGLAVGGILYTRLAARVPVGAHTFAVTCLLEAAAVAMPFALGDRIALLAFDLRPAPGALLQSYVAGWTAVTAIVVLPPSIVAGAQFPLLVALLGSGRTHVARHLGQAYFWNTVGGIAGALAGGFGLLPLLTAPGCWRATALLLAGLALVAAFSERRRESRLLAATSAGVLAVAAMLLVADGPTAAWRHSAIGVGRATAPLVSSENARRAWIHEARRSIVWEREGVESSVAVQTLAGLSFVVNGKVDGNARNDAPTQVVSGLLGALLRPGAQRSLVIGLGTGSTVGWLAAVPGMQRADVVELEPAILDVARMCAPVNRGAMDDPRVDVILGDAREVLTTRRERYDLVLSEPSNPYRAGVASLFTREFYQAVASRLEDDGVFVQWVQAYEVDADTVATVVATVADVFPAVEVWQSHQMDLLVIGSRRVLRHDAGALRERIREEPFATALRGAWRATELEDVLARFVAGPALAESLRARRQPINRDDRNLVEFSFAQTLSRSGLFEVGALRQAAAELGAGRPLIDGAVDWERVERQRVAIYTIAGRAAPAGAGLAAALAARVKAHGQYVSGDLAPAARSLATLTPGPEGAVETTLMADGLADAGDPAAVPYIQALRAIEPTEAEAATARLALRSGQTDLARDALVASFVHYRSEPWPNQISMAHALALAAELAAARPDTATALFDALGRPFAVAALEELRRLVRLQVAWSGGLLGRCNEALEPFEPHMAWRADVLRYRVTCYEKRRDPRAVRARQDLETFLRQEPPQPGPTAAPAPGRAKS